MPRILVLFFILFAFQFSHAQNARKTIFSAPLTGTASFADPKFDDYAPGLIHLDQNPIPYAEFGNKKALLNKKRRATILPKSVESKTRGAAPDPFLIREFDGNAATSIPLDNDIAVSNNGIIISSVNANIFAYDTLGTRLMNKSINAMDSVTNVFSWISDPRLLYDPKNDRFIMTCFSGSISTASRIIIGFSTTNNPADDWNFYTITGNPFNDSTWSDYPIISISDKDFFLTMNQIKDNIGWQNGFRQSVIYQFKKEDGYAGNALQYTLWDQLNYKGINFRNICPARYQETEMGDDMYFLSVRNVADENDTIFLLHINNAFESGKAAMDIQVLKSPVNYGFPPNPPMPGGQYLMTNDARILSAIYENDYIHFGGNSINFDYNNAGVFLGEIQNVCSKPIVKASVISTPSQEFGYPSMTYVGTQAGSHKVFYAFDHCYTDSLPGVSAVFKNPNGYSNIITIKDGTTYVNRLTDSNERWGDYSGIQKKYNEPGTAFLAGCYGRNNGWSTRIGVIRNMDSTLLPIVQNPNDSLKVYPNPTADRLTIQFELQNNTNLKFNIYDMNGRRIKQILEQSCKKGRNEFSFSLDPLAKGNYLFVIEGENQQILTKKITRQ